MKAVDQWQKDTSRCWLRNRAEISTQVLHPTTILEACCRQRVLRQMLVLLRRKVRPLMYYQAINSVKEARSSIMMRFKDQFCGWEKNDFFLSPSLGLASVISLLFFFAPSCAHKAEEICLTFFFFFRTCDLFMPSLNVLDNHCVNFVSGCLSCVTWSRRIISHFVRSPPNFDSEIQTWTAELVLNDEAHLLLFARIVLR